MQWAISVSDEESRSVPRFSRMEREAPSPLGLILPAWPSTTRAISLWRIKSSSILKFTPDGNRSTFASQTCPQSEAQVSKLTAWSLTVRAIFLSQTIPAAHMSIKFSPDGTKSAFASGVRGAWPLTERAISLGRTRTATRSSKFTPDGTSSSFAVDVSSTSPDKKWEFVGGGQPRILEAGTHQVGVLDLSEIAAAAGRFGRRIQNGLRSAIVFMATADIPLNRSHFTNCSAANGKHCTHRRTTYPGQPIGASIEKALPKKFNPRDCSSNSDVLDFREWTDAPGYSILYAPCYRPDSEKVKAGFLFTLKFDAAGKWKIVKTHQMSEKRSRNR